MAKKIVLATRNAHKSEELSRILRDLHLDVEVLSVADFPDAPEVEETESTFVGNAFLKARALMQFTGLPAVADDSGLCVDALDGAPGIFSARYSGATENVDEANLELVLQNLQGVPKENRGARFVCAAVLVTPNGEEVAEEGVVEGTIRTEPAGENGFGYDPIFEPTGFAITTAQMSAEEKDAISHRGQALRQLAKSISALVN